MCGIAGFLDFTGRRTRAVSTKENSSHFTKALESIKSRGPDAEGQWQDRYTWFGHRRLSIVDTSARGNQPMMYGDLVIAYNGMIFNFRDIRQTLIQKGYIK